MKVIFSIPLCLGVLILILSFFCKDKYYVLHLNGTCICFMFIGVATYFLYIQKITFPTFSCLSLVLLLLTSLCLRYSPFLSAVHKFQFISYIFAFITFMFFYFFRDSIKHNSILKFLADISYPLYAIHAILGYILIRLFLEYKLSPELSVGIACILVLGLAYCLHIFIEKPFIKVAKHLCGLVKKD